MQTLPLSTNDMKELKSIYPILSDFILSIDSSLKLGSPVVYHLVRDVFVSFKKLGLDDVIEEIKCVNDFSEFSDNTKLMLLYSFEKIINFQPNDKEIVLNNDEKYYLHQIKIRFRQYVDHIMFSLRHGVI